MSKPSGIFRGHRLFLYALKKGNIIPLKDVIIVEGQERYLVDKDHNLTPLELNDISYDPFDILGSKKAWEIEKK